MFAYCGNNPVNYLDSEGERPIGFGLQFDFTAGDETVGVEIVVYYDETVCDGKGPVVVYYFYSGTELSAEALLFLDDMITKLATITVIDAGDMTSDAVLFFAKAYLEGINFSGSFFLLDGNDKFAKPGDYSGTFETVSFTGTFMGKQAGMYYSFCESCCAVGIKVGVDLQPGFLPINLSYSRTVYSKPHLLMGVMKE